jgi:hypothetical protein
MSTSLPSHIQNGRDLSIQHLKTQCTPASYLRLTCWPVSISQSLLASCRSQLSLDYKLFNIQKTIFRYQISYTVCLMMPNTKVCIICFQAALQTGKMIHFTSDLNSKNSCSSESKQYSCSWLYQLTRDISGQIILCSGSCSMHGGVFVSITGLYTLDALSTASLSPIITAKMTPYTASDHSV